jgi:hypothetical protein
MTKRYKVIAKMTTYLYVHVDAEYAVDAIAIAKDMDGGDFIPFNQGIVAEGDWKILDAHLELDHHPDCPAVDGFGCRCTEIEEVSK